MTCYYKGCDNYPRYRIYIKIADKRYKPLDICFDHFWKNVKEENDEIGDNIYHLIIDKNGESCNFLITRINKCKIGRQLGPAGVIEN